MPSGTDGNLTYRCNVAIRLIDFETIDRPVGVRESRGVVLHVIVAGIGEGGAVGAGAPNGSGPVATEVCVEDLVAPFSAVVIADIGRCERWKAEFDCEDGARKGSYNLQVRKVTWNIAIPLILRDRLFPGCWIRCSCFKV